MAHVIEVKHRGGARMKMGRMSSTAFSDARECPHARKAQKTKSPASMFFQPRHVIGCAPQCGVFFSVFCREHVGQNNLSPRLEHAESLLEEFRA
jgi:hypothetical protein